MFCIPLSLSCKKMFLIRKRLYAHPVDETLIPNGQNELWQTFEETSGYVRPERVNKWPNSMKDI